MLKGVNRKVVEVHNPDSLYFEKAVFYLKPNLTQVPMALLTAEARHCLHRLPPPGRTAHRHAGRCCGFCCWQGQGRLASCSGACSDQKPPACTDRGCCFYVVQDAWLSLGLPRTHLRRSFSEYIRSSASFMS